MTDSALPRRTTPHHSYSVAVAAAAAATSLHSMIFLRLKYFGCSLQLKNYYFLVPKRLADLASQLWLQLVKPLIEVQPPITRSHVNFKRVQSHQIKSLVSRCAVPKWNGPVENCLRWIQANLKCIAFTLYKNEKGRKKNHLFSQWLLRNATSSQCLCLCDWLIHKSSLISATEHCT